MYTLLFALVPVMGVIGLLYTLVKFNWVSKQDAGNERMQEISKYISEGAMAFLKAEWKILGYFVVIVAILLGVMASSNPSSHWFCYWRCMQCRCRFHWHEGSYQSQCTYGAGCKNQLS